MIVVCPQCTTRFRVDDERVAGRTIKLRCSRCAHVFAYTGPEPEPALDEASDSNTRRVDAAAMIAMALESAQQPTHDVPAAVSPPPSSTPPPESTTQEVDVGLDDLGFDVPQERDGFADFFDDEDRSDLFEELDGLDQLGFGPSDAVQRMVPPSSSLDEALRGPSVDLPSEEGFDMDGFLDGGPSTDLALAEALESDFLPERAPPARADQRFGPESRPRAAQEDAVQSLRAEAARLEAERPPSSPIIDDDDLLEDTSWVREPLARLELASAGDDATRVAGRARRDPPRAPELRRRSGWWPSAVGLLLGGAVVSTFFGGWAPPPFDRIAPEVAELLHSDIRPRTEGAVADVVGEGTRAFPYTVGQDTIVVVRGEARNLGDEPQTDLWATVLVLEGDREVTRARARLGDVPGPAELRERLAGRSEAPNESSGLEAGASAPFLVWFEDPPPGVHGFEFRVEFGRSPR